MEILIDGLTVKYGELTAVDGLNLRIDRGEVFGFIGPNGAGKTTTIRVMATLLTPTLGRVFIDGLDVVKDADRIRARIGYMPDFFGVYDNLKVWEYLDFFGSVYGVDRDRIKSRIDEVLEITKLGVKRDSYVEELSRGMKQRLCLARTLIHDPELFILDEPAAGLDPKGRIEIRELIKDLSKRGKTIFISSHILAELADICTSIGIIEKGKLIKAGKLDEMKDEFGRVRKFSIRVMEVAKGLKALEELEGILSLSAEGELITAKIPDNDVVAERLIKTLVESGARPVSIQEEKLDLEGLYLGLTKGMVI